ncbi:hypothetical protein Tco_0011573 [Tanacetum coccineum]
MGVTRKSIRTLEDYSRSSHEGYRKHHRASPKGNKVARTTLFARSRHHPVGLQERMLISTTLFRVDLEPTSKDFS